MLWLGDKLGSEDTLSLLHKANALFVTDKKNDAIIYFDLVLKLNPVYTAIYRNKGSVLYALEKMEEALECYDEAIRLEPI